MRRVKKVQGSRHHTTMHTVDRAGLGDDVPLPRRHCGYELYGEIVTEQVLVLAVKDQPELEQPLRYALGSGKFARTFINVHEKDSVVEIRESYYPSLRKWMYTPGQAHIEGDGLGRMYSGMLARACVACHTVAVPPDNLNPEPRFFGVGCDSCHGPGRDHVAAARAGKLDNLHIARLGSLGAAALNERCGRCHRSAKNVPATEKSTQRFQPFGLMKSRCFLENGDTLSCQTCHDPHTDASTDQKGYEKEYLPHLPLRLRSKRESAREGAGKGLPGERARRLHPLPHAAPLRHAGCADLDGGPLHPRPYGRLLLRKTSSRISAR